MRNSRSIKGEFLWKWIKGLRKCSSEKNMSLLERKKAIKLSADLAMASTRGETSRWSQALILNASRDHNKVLTDHIIGSSSSLLPHPQQQQQCQSLIIRNKSFNKLRSSPRIRSRKIVRRCRAIGHRVRKEKVMANSIAKRVVQKKTQRLKKLLPGGEFMDDVSLVEETLDYIQSLRAQVEVMRCLVTASQLLIHPS